MAGLIREVLGMTVTEEARGLWSLGGGALSDEVNQHCAGFISSLLERHRLPAEDWGRKKNPEGIKSFTNNISSPSKKGQGGCPKVESGRAEKRGKEN